MPWPYSFHEYFNTKIDNTIYSDTVFCSVLRYICDVYDKFDLCMQSIIVSPWLLILLHSYNCMHEMLLYIETVGFFCIAYGSCQYNYVGLCFLTQL